MNLRRALLNGVLAIGVAGAGVGIWAVVGRSKSVSAQTATVVTAAKGNVLSSVSGTGNVLAPSQVDVSFDSAVASNKVLEVNVKVGDKVTKGQALARVDDTTLQQALQAAQAQLATAQAALDKTQNGLTEQDQAQLDASLAQSNLGIQSAQAALANAQDNYNNDVKLQDTAVAQSQAALDAAKAKADLDLSNAQTGVDQAQATLDSDNAKLVTAQATLAAATTVQAQAAAQTAVDQATATVAKDTGALTTAKNQLASAQLSTQQSVANAQNALTNTTNGRDTKVTADDQAVANANRQVTSAKASYQATLAANAVKAKTPTDADLAAPRASLLNAQNSLATAQRNLDNVVLKASADGTVAAVTGKVGSAASSGSSSSSSSGSGGGASSSSSSSSSGFLTLADLTNLEVKVGFSEADATRVKAGLGGTATFDSLPNARFTGKLRQIDLTSTTVSNVVTYYAYLTLDQNASLNQVKPGMTANVVVTVEHADGVITLPASAVTARGTNANVNVQTGATTDKVESRPITIGLKGDTAVEIKTGLNVGDKVVIIRQAAASGTGTNRTGGLPGGATGGGITGGGAVPGGGGGPPAGAGGGGGRGG